MTRNWGLTSILLLAPVMLPAQGIELRGRVVNDSGVVVRGAVVTLSSLRYSVRPDSSGRFRLSGTAGGTLELSFSAPGYRTTSVSVTLPRSGSLSRDFQLESDGSPEPVETTRYLRGVVVDTAGTPVSFANLQLNGGRRWVATDSGRFSIPLTMGGEVSILARRIGYEAAVLRVNVDTDTVIAMQLKPTSTILPETQVLGRAAFTSLDLGGFYKRMKDTERGAQVAYFVTPEELEIRRPVNFTDAIQHFPGIRLRPGTAMLTRSGRSMNHPANLRVEDANGCPMTVYLDGVRITPVRASGGTSGLQDEQINALVAPGSTAGIEVYPRAAFAPADYPAYGQTCGVVLTWSK